MQKVIVQVDWYAKIVLTLIVVLLAGLLAKSYIEPQMAKASYEQRIRNDVSVGGALELFGSRSFPLYIAIIR